MAKAHSQTSAYQRRACQKCGIVKTRCSFPGPGAPNCSACEKGQPAERICARWGCGVKFRPKPGHDRQVYHSKECQRGTAFSKAQEAAAKVVRPTGPLMGCPECRAYGNARHSSFCSKAVAV
jgi:hypothetical protein